MHHCRSRGSRQYLVPEGSSVPEGLALLQDERALAVGCDEYYLCPSAPCTPEEYEKNLVDFVLDERHVVFRVHELSASKYPLHVIPPP